MRDYKGIRVLVADGYGRQIPSILKQLHDLGCIITTINCSKLDVGYTSRYPHRRVVVNGIREDVKLYEKAIRRELRHMRYDVVFPMLEPSTEILHKLKRLGRLGDTKLIAAPYEAFSMAYNKQLTMETCMDNGIPCPVTKRDSESLEEFLSKVSFPLAAKPRKGSGGAGFKKIRDRSELDRYISEGTIIPEEYVIQEYIEQDQFMCNCYVMMDDSHKPVYSVAIRTYRWFPVDGGPGCFGRTITQPLVTENAVRLFEALKWSGFGQVSFMMDSRDGIPKVTEINGRISAGIKIVDYAGCTPVKFMLDRAYGKHLTPVRKEIKEGLGLRYFHTDILWLLKSPNRFRAKPSWFDFRHTKDYIFSWSDPIPFFSYGIEHMLTFKKDMKRRKH